ncbi:MAG TPA: TetR/AcrR family transcriptional regulator [Polyangiaceae bacterium]
MVSATEAPADSREKILTAARAEFAENGFDGARVDRIARRAKVNKALIYYYFKGKDELLQELLRVFVAERRTRRPKLPSAPGKRDLPARVAQFDVDFLFERRDILRIALMEDLKASKDGIPGPGTLLRHWLDGLAEAREQYTEEGYGFRYTPRVVAAIYFFHLMPTLAFCTMGETLAKAVGLDLETLRGEFLTLLVEMGEQHFYSVFGRSSCESTAEVTLPGLVPRPPSDVMQRVHRAFHEGELYTAEEAAALLKPLVEKPDEIFAKLVGLRLLRYEAGGQFRWVGAVNVPGP